MSLSFSTPRPHVDPDAGQTWEDASAATAVRLAREFEAAWRASASRRPDPAEFLTDTALECPGARLAVLRAEMTLRWEDGDRIGADWYQRRYPNLDDETLVALVYEEFCLREDEQEAPDPAEFLARYPSVEDRLRRVLDIHDLVGSAPTTLSLNPHSSNAFPAFPEAGQTIAGFHLVEELGRGAFARVFLARERQLADRPVALKVSRTGTREPQTLARLQHTHIVPVHSYRTDPATDLHLLCMPHFGRLTLSQILSDPQVRVARSGADLVSALDRLSPDPGPSCLRSAGRLALAQRDFAQAIAWWGARMAEALDHAHDRGVLHRDVKPSNVLVTTDGMPMLLDFNLARVAVLDESEGATDALGGTLDYMSPEHIDELVEGTPGRVDARSDVYGLGVLLFEALMGAKPFAPPGDALSPREVLLRAAEERRAAVPSLRQTHPEVPAAFEAVIRRCLAPHAESRYRSAADLAADLQAIADDQPLRFAREPLSSSVKRWTRRHRRALVMAAPLICAVAVGAAVLHKTQSLRGQWEQEVSRRIDEGQIAARSGRYAEAIDDYEDAIRLANQHPYLRPLHKQASDRLALARQQAGTYVAAEALFRSGESLRYRLAGFDGNLAEAAQTLQIRLQPFHVLSNDDWTHQTDLQLLDAKTRARLTEEVDELLFLWVLALDGANDPQAKATCERALRFTKAPGPWRALHDRRTTPPQVSSESSALACFLWGAWLVRQDRRADAIPWLRRSVDDLAPDDSWRHAYLAWVLKQEGQSDAMAEAKTAVGLRKQSPWARLTRGRIALSLADHDRAVKDYQEALHLLNRDLENRDPALEWQIQRELDLLAR